MVRRTQFMDDNKGQSGGVSFSLEALEERRLMAGAPWGPTAQLIDQDVAASSFRRINGKGYSVAVLDTGVDYTHPSLGGRWGRVVIGGYDFVRNDNDPMDETGHGTQVAGMIAAKRFTYEGRSYQGIATGAKIVALRVEDNSDFLPDSRLERALRWVIDNRKKFKIAAVNMSLGDGLYTRKTSLKPFGDELAILKRAGVFITAASGNGGLSSREGINYPAADRSVVGVGSVNGADVISSFTSRSSILDLLAPGDGVAAPSTLADGRHVFTRGNGTSYSSPIVAGAALLLKQANPKLNVNQILTILRNTASRNWDGDDEYPATYLTY